mmetsp:Transcript_72475/g.198589  ORF Transcript_72475/g.198589 Transcript_72475/m.198589 type:complete len:257 (-) Transcript_72475:860-1630(-)
MKRRNLCELTPVAPHPLAHHTHMVSARPSRARAVQSTSPQRLASSLLCAGARRHATGCGRTTASTRRPHPRVHTPLGAPHAVGRMAGHHRPRLCRRRRHQRRAMSIASFGRRLYPAPLCKVVVGALNRTVGARRLGLSSLRGAAPHGMLRKDFDSEAHKVGNVHMHEPLRRQAALAARRRAQVAARELACVVGDIPQPDATRERGVAPSRVGDALDLEHRGTGRARVHVGESAAVDTDDAGDAGESGGRQRRGYEL